MTPEEKQELKEILMQCHISTKTAAKVLFPEVFTAPFSSLHNQVFDLIDSGHRKIAIAAPRGLGKTSIARTVLSKKILFRDVNFACYVSNSATSAEMQTENIKRSLQSSRLIRQFFGSIKLSDNPFSEDDTFSKKAWVAFGNTFVLPRGWGQQVRGLNWANYRPQLVIIDDLENKEEIKNEDIRKKMKEWFFSDLLKTESMYGEPCVFIYIDTIKHEDSLLQNLLDSPEWASVRLSICDDNFESKDENYMTTEEIKQEYEEHKDKGLTDLFFMERMNIPISLEDAVFKVDRFKYFNDYGDELKVYEKDKTVTVRKRDLTVVVIVDPAKTVKLHSAESAVVTIGVDRRSRRLFVLDIVSDKFYPDQLYNAMFDAVVRHKARVLAVEVTSLHQFISQPIESEMRVRGIYPFYVELNAQGKKEDRVATLAPLYRLGYMYHNKANCLKLETQLQWFPRSKRWDVMDATGYITKLMDELAYYFDPEDLPEGADEFEELSEEDDLAMEDDWRAF